MPKSTFRNYSKTYFFNACFDKNQLKNLISWFIKYSGEKITVDFLETLKQIGFHQATLAGVSLGLEDLQIPSQKSLLISQAKADVSLFEQQSRCGNLTSVEKSQQMISTWNQTSEFLRKTAVQQFKINNPVNPVYMMAFSGARGNISQVRQLVAMRGLMADPQGVILEFPIQSNFREGLTLTEYLISCYGARKGLVDTALRTATSGYLTRRLVDAAQHVIVSTKDCGATQGIILRNKDLEQHLIGRVLSKDLVLDHVLDLKKNQKISPTLAKLIAKNFKEVFVRSPLTCQAENSICQLCYGWNLAHGHLVSIGEAVGVIAAQSIGEPGTQLTMRTFHTGGVGVFSDQAMKYFLAPYDGIIEYTQELPGHFVRTPYGKIVYMLKNSSSSTQSIIFKLKSLDRKQTQYSIKKQELPPGSILLVRQGERVKTGQVLAQSSQIKKSKQKMPESSHPVFSPIHGEIYLESMSILKQKQLSLKPKKIKKIQKKEKEIGPEFRTLKGLGCFWIFSSENIQQNHNAKTILRPGDLVSSKSSLFQYDFYFPNRSNFHTILNKNCLGLNFVSLPLEKINFHKVTYSMVLKNSLSFSKQNQSNKKEFLFFNKKRLQNFLIWLPQESFIPNSGYFFNFLLYAGIKNNAHSLSSLSNQTKKILDNDWFHGSFFYFTTQIQKWRMHRPFCFGNNGISYFLILKNQNKLQQYLLLQYDPTPRNLSTKLCLHSQVEKRTRFKKIGFLEKNVKKFSGSKKQVGSVSKKEVFGTNVVFEKGNETINKKSFWSATARNRNKNTKIKTKFFYFKQKNYIIDSISNNQTDFLKRALNRVKSSISSNYAFSSVFFHEKNGWIYIPITKKIINKYKKSQKLLIFEQGKIFDNLLFLNSKIGIKYIPTNKIGLVKSLKNKKSNPYYQNVWYSKESFLTKKNFLQSQRNKSIYEFSNEKNYPQSSIKLNPASLLERLAPSSVERVPLVKIEKISKQSFCILKQERTNSFKCFLYYKLQKLDLRTNKPILNITNVVRKPQQVSQNTTKCFLFVYLLNEFSLPKKAHLIKQWNSIKKLHTSYLTNSPLFTKQEFTIFSCVAKNLIDSKNETTGILGTENKKLKKQFNLILSGSTGWFSSKNIFKLIINLNSPSLFKKLNQSYLLSNYLKNQKSPVTGLNLFFYNYISLPENVSFNFEIFENTWVIPNNRLTTGFIRITKDGEFRRLKLKKNKSVVSILTKQNIVTVDLSNFITPNHTKNFNKNKQVKIGHILRSETEIFSSIASSTSGFILNKKFMQFTIRLGIPFLASDRGILHVFQHDVVQKNDLLVTLKSRRLQTEDIVQGIPKIEQLFEARETQGGTIIRNSVHTRLKKYFISCLKFEKISSNNLHTNLSTAITNSLNKIQFFLVQSILQAYSSQGVTLSQKHIEIIVRQMTTRVRILAGGDSGLLPGELIQFTKIKKLNDQLCSLGKRPAFYEPIILGITKSVLQSESFLLSASFQEVSRVLVRSALTKRSDFLRGLHENVILGQLVPTGTGLVSTNRIIEK